MDSSVATMPLEALKRLANFSETAERRRLLAIAWRAGHRNINQLRSWSGASRQTIYTDLAAEGINVDDRDAPIVAAPALPETAEPSLIGELRAAALAAIAARAHPEYRADPDPGAFDVQDRNPHTRELDVYDLARILTFSIGARGEGMYVDAVDGLIVTIKNTTDAAAAPPRARWVAWELRRLGAPAEAERFDVLAEHLAEHGTWPPPPWG